MKKLMMTIVAAMMAAVTMAGTSFAYQGVLRSSDGGSVGLQKRIEFRLYNQATGGAVLWGRAFTVNLDANGLFNVELSDSGSLISGVVESFLESVIRNETKSGRSLYLGIKVDNSSGEITPRQKVISAPIAAFAQDVNIAKDDFTVDGNLIVNNGLKMSSTATNAVAELRHLKVTGNATFSGTVLAPTSDIKAESASFTGGVKVKGVEVNLPLRAIIMWSGADNEVPDGWALCNGQTVRGITTPDLRGRFIVGSMMGVSTGLADVDKYTTGNVGGSTTVALTVNEMPSHNHNVTMKNRNYGDRGDQMAGFNAGVQDSTATVTSDSKGGGQAHENRPRYFALCFIMKVK